MRHRRGTFLRNEMEETVTINGAVLSDYQQKIIILPDRRERTDSQGFTTQELYYHGTVYPPNFAICINDLITRYPRDKDHQRGSSSGQLQVLVVQQIEVVFGKQSLTLQDRDRIVR